MIEKTLFTKKEIIFEIEKEYGIIISNVKHINKGSANIFVLKSKNQKYVLKEFQSKYDKEKILKEYNLIKKLKGIDTYTYELTKDFNCYFLHKDKLCILMKFIKGKSYSNNKLNLEKLKKVAKIHSVITKNLTQIDEIKLPFENFLTIEKINKNKQYMIEYICKITNNKNEYKTLLDTPFNIGKFYNEFFSKNYKLTKKIQNIICDYVLKINIINSLSLNNIFKQLNDITCINSHGDFSTQQLIFDKEKIFVLDFASSRKLPICWEVIRSYSYCDKNCKNGRIDIENFASYTKSFCENFHLSKYEISNMIMVYLLQLLSSNFGYKQFIESNNRELLKFAKFRTKLCLDLFENINVYNNYLLSKFDI